MWAATLNQYPAGTKRHLRNTSSDHQLMAPCLRRGPDERLTLMKRLLDARKGIIPMIG